MNKITKSILALGLALSILVGVGGTSVFAGSRNVLKIKDYYAIAESRISEKSAWAKTSFESGGKVTVNSLYIYLNTKNLNSYTTRANRSGIESVSLRFNAPANCRSVRIVTNHRVEVYGTTWNSTTNISY